MNKFLLSCILFSLNCMFIYAEPNYPVDISYLVVDLKYSQEDGLKICEVQQGGLSAVTGDLFIFGGDGTIGPKIADFFTPFPLKKWAAGLIYPPLQRSLVAKGWSIEPSFTTLLQDPTFLACGAMRPLDPFCIRSYAGIVYADFEVARTIEFYRKAYPGIIFINAVTFPYWRDKYKMSVLFDGNDELKRYKADWRLYPKHYDPLLSARIQEEMPSEYYVIKPKSEVLANGVIVVANKDLDKVLHMILEPVPCLEKHSDKKYAYWGKNRDDTFLIEKYYKSDYLRCSLPLGEKLCGETECPTQYTYDATMRIACILCYDGRTMTYHNLGAFWKLPCKALEEEGTLNETRISFCKPPFYLPVDEELLKEVNAHMERAMLLLYEIMLNGPAPAQ